MATRAREWALTAVLVTGLATGLALAVPEAVRAQDDGDQAGSPDGEGIDEDLAHDDVGFDLHADFGYYLAAGVGLRVDLPVVPEGLIDGADEDLRISLGGELLWFFGDPGGLAVLPLLAFQWNFYLNEKWSIFPELGAVMLFMNKDERNQFWRTFVAPFAGFGVRYHFSPRNALLFRVNWPAGLQIGLTF